MRKISRLAALFMAVIIVLMGVDVNAFAEETASGSFGENMTWTLEDGTLTISGTGAMPDWEWEDYEDVPWYAISDSIITVVVESGVTTIGAYAFCSFYGHLEEVIIAEGVTSIGRNAFNYCTSLKTVDLPDSLETIGIYAFANCHSLEAITLPDSLTTIKDGAFWKCTGLKSLTLSSGCGPLTIELNNFSFCDFESLSVEPGNPYYDSRNDCNAIIETASSTLIIGCKNTVIPSGVTGIKWPGFSFRTGLTSIEIPYGVTTIGERAFWYCTNLAEITIPESVTYIGWEAFEDCSSLTEITVPSQVTRIEHSIFFGCSSLTDITIPAGVTFIGDCAFKGCSALADISLPSGVTEMGWGIFQNCSSLTGVTLPSGVTNLGDWFFRNCNSLTSVIIPANVKSIGEKAFEGCTSLTGILIPAGSALETVGANAFDGQPVVYFGGTEEDRNGIEIDSSNGILSSVWVYNWSHPVVLTHHAAQEPTYTAQGSTEYWHCSDCGKFYSDACGENEIEEGSWALDYLAPETPVLAGASGASDGITVTWEAADGADSYTIYRKTGEDDWEQIAEGITEESYTDTSAELGVMYHYTVGSYNNTSGKSGAYDETGLAAAAVGKPVITGQEAGTDGIYLEWSAASGATDYAVYRKPADGGEWEKIAQNLTETAYADTEASEGTEYLYKIEACITELGVSGVFSDEQPGVWFTVLEAPELSMDSGNVKVSWERNSMADGYGVFRKEEEGEYELAATVENPSSGETAEWTDETAEHEKTYSYYVIPYKLIGDERYFGVYGGTDSEITVQHLLTKVPAAEPTYSTKGNTEYWVCEKCGRYYSDSEGVNEISEGSWILDYLSPQKPVLSKTSSSTGGITVKWEAAEGATSYRIYRKTAGGSWERIAKTVTALSYKDTTAETGILYYYTVRSYNGTSKKQSGYDETGLAGLMLAKAVITKTKAFTGGVYICWDAVPGATSYKIYRKPVGGSGWTKIVSGRTKTYYKDTTAEPGRLYYYKVKAYSSKAGVYGEASLSAKGFYLDIVTANLSVYEGKIRVSWDQVAGADAYAIYRKEDDGSFTLVKRVAQKSSKTTRNWYDKTVTAGSTYTYIIRPYKIINHSRIYGAYRKAGSSAVAK